MVYEDIIDLLHSLVADVAISTGKFAAKDYNFVMSQSYLSEIEGKHPSESLEKGLLFGIQVRTTPELETLKLVKVV